MERSFTDLRLTSLTSLYAACKQGLAAGKLYIGGEQAETIDKSPFVCSGFCLEDRFFATTQHFLRLNPDDPAASAQGEHLAQLRDPNSAEVKISTARKSKSMVNNGEKAHPYHSHSSDVV